MQDTRFNLTFKFVAAAATAAIAAAMIAVGAPSASAAARTVQVPPGKDLFVAQNLGNVNVGDTITWKNNDVHNVYSAKVPAGVVAFFSPMLVGGAATYAQKVTVPGNYRYFCKLHASLAEANAAKQDPTKMVGQFTVVAAPLVESPVVVAPVKSPVVVTPVKAPTVVAPVKAPTVVTPVKAPAVVTPVTPRAVQVPAGKDLFTPANLGTINGGDTITWKNNDVHNVYSAKIPAGAVVFTSPMLIGSAAKFTQKVTVPGNYRYYCKLHASLADANAATQDPAKMVGQFTVSPGGAAGAPVEAAPVEAAPVEAAPVEAAVGGVAVGGVAQVFPVPTGGVQSGGGSTAGFNHAGLVTLGGGLLIAAFMSALVGQRFARREFARIGK